MKKIFLLVCGLFLVGCGEQVLDSNEQVLPDEMACLERDDSSDFAVYNYKVCLTGNVVVDSEMELLISELSEDVMFAGMELQKVDSSGKGGLYISQDWFSSVDDVKSVLLTVSSNTGGAHPNTNFYAWTYHEESGEVLQFRDLFQREHNPLWTIYPMVKDVLMGRLESYADEEMIDRGTGDEVFGNYRSFVVDGDVLRIYFPPYQVAAYAIGPQVVEVSLDDLGAILAPPFLKVDGEHVAAIDYGSGCEDEGGTWLAGYRECEYVSREWCDNEMGEFRECESACRHTRDEVVACTMQCVPVCKL